MIKNPVFCSVFLFFLAFPVFPQNSGSESRGNSQSYIEPEIQVQSDFQEENSAQPEKTSEPESVQSERSENSSGTSEGFLFRRKFDNEFYLQTNFSLSGGYNFTSRENYPFAKLNVDIVEAWFGRLGVGSVAGITFGFNPEKTNILITQMICPGLNFSWDLGLGIYVSAGVNMLCTWHYFRETKTTESFTVSTSGGNAVLQKTASTTENTTTLRSYGLSVPIRFRYAFNRHIALYGEYNFSAYPWISVSTAKSPDWIFENTLNAGISFSIPIRF